MLIEAYKFLTTYKPEIAIELIDLFNQTAIGVCEGQQQDMDFENSDSVTKDEYLEMIRLKTAVLLGCSFKMGAIIAGANAENQKDIYNFGVNLGIAFQLQDDILDLYADQSQFGKQVGGDILANKKTYLLLSAFETASEAQKSELNNMLNSTESTTKIVTAKKIFAELNIKQKAEEKMNHFYQTALSNVNHLQIDESGKEVLSSIAAYLMTRMK
jgi:geranylgeranyl diphosphate synthase type II